MHICTYPTKLCSCPDSGPPDFLTAMTFAAAAVLSISTINKKELVQSSCSTCSYEAACLSFQTTRYKHVIIPTNIQPLHVRSFHNKPFPLQCESSTVKRPEVQPAKKKRRSSSSTKRTCIQHAWCYAGRMHVASAERIPQTNGKAANRRTIPRTNVAMCEGNDHQSQSIRFFATLYD